MNRSSFGRWGANLSKEEFAKALAIIGVHNATFRHWPISGVASEIAERISKSIETASEPLRCDYFFTPPNKWRLYTQIPSSNQLAAAWDKLQPRIIRPKFEIKLS